MIKYRAFFFTVHISKPFKDFKMMFDEDITYIMHIETVLAEEPEKQASSTKYLFMENQNIFWKTKREMRQNVLG